MSGAQTSTFTNQLYDPLMAGRQQAQTNALAVQQQEISSNEMEQASRAANWVLTQDDKPAAYSTALRLLKANGYAKNSPDAYPGDAAMSYLARQSLTVPQQYNLGLVTSPASDELTRLYTGGKPPTAPGSTPGATTPPAGGGGTSDNNFGNIRPTGASSGFNTYSTPQEGVAAMSSNLAAYANQHGIKTLNGLTARWAPKGDGNNDPTAYAASLGKMLGLDPNAEINLADPLLQSRLIPAMAQIEKGRPFSQPREVLLGGIQAGLGGAPATAAAAPPGTPPGAVPPRPTQFAGPGAPPPPAATTAPPGTDLNGPRPLPSIGPGSPVVTPQSLANTPTPTLAPQNQVMPGQPNGPPAATPPPAAVAPPAATPPTAPAQPASTLPHASELPTGQSSPQVQQAQALLARAAQIKLVAARQPGNLQLKAQADAMVADLTQKAQNLMQSDSVVQTQEGQVHTLTGKIDDPAKPLSDYHETTPGSGIWVGGPGTEPRFQPPGRLVVGPDGTVWQTSTSGAHVLQPSDPAAIAARKAAEASGTATGTQTVKQYGDIVTRARDAAAQEGQIDYASNQLREAAKGGIPTGYFSDALATGAAAAKSLGLTDTLKSLGVDPEAVGNMQTAQKTLSVIGGAILRQALGPGSAITDAKVEQFIHTQPGIMTDPQALQRIMAWARSQFTYERELGHAAVTEAAKPENAGRLPAHWLPAYYRDHGFAPIYDPDTQEMQQPDGRQPTRETPPPTQNAPVFKEGATATGKDGHKIIFRNGVWVPQ